MTTILVTGATGRVGRHVVQGLLEAGTTVRALVRDPAALPSGIEFVQGDIYDEPTVERAAAGMDAAFLLWPSFSAAGAQPVVAALTEQVPRVVYLSSMGVRDDLPPAANGVWGEIEDLLIGSDWTFLRPGGFAANTLNWADDVRRGDVVRVSSPEAGRSLIHERDIAAVAVLALLDDKHIGQKYTLTGPETLTQTEQIAILSKALGKPIQIEELTPTQARQQMLDQGADPLLAESSVTYWASLVDNPEPVTTTIPALLHRRALTYSEWAEEHADKFRN
ncbi:NAD(P)H-binding protein [Kribbella sp. NPDC006257]|uniref:SDR family oxidoreductase n=1 Tax=Kribbella sp. NPDC006257 TaxID=3156738 RepID=UPI0033AAC2A6